jgi:hypothetical protein
MLNEKDLKRIEERIKEFFKKADQEIELEMSFNEEEKNVLEINICKLDDAKMFIGRQNHCSRKNTFPSSKQHL